MAPSAVRRNTRIALVCLCSAAFVGAAAAQYSPLRRVTGTVKLKDKATLDRQIEVQLISQDGRPREKVFTDSLGNFQFMTVSQGIYILVIDVPGYRRIEERVELTPTSTGPTMTQRQFVLEPLAAANNSPPAEAVSAEKFRVSKDAREAFEKGEKELNRRNYARALELLDKAIQIEPKFADALYARGVVHLQNDRLDLARASFAEAVAVNPQHGDAHIGLGAAAVRAGNAQAAMESLTRGLAIAPNSYLGLFESCRARFALNDLEAAEKDCLRARDVAEGQRPELNIQLGNLYARTGRNAEAIREFEGYLKMAGHSPTADYVRKVIKALRAEK